MRSLFLVYLFEGLRTTSEMCNLNPENEYVSGGRRARGN